MDYATALDVGERKRRQDGINEDSVAVTLIEEGHRDTERTSGVFVVADGAGGTQAGDIASYVASVEVSRRLTDRLWRERLLSEAADAVGANGAGGHALELTDGVVGDPLADQSDEAVQTVIERAVQAAHTRIVRVINDLDIDSAYTTIVAAVVAGDRLHYGWVGDSRAYVVNLGDRDDGQQVTRLTTDHSEVERLVEQGKIDEVEAHVHRRNNRITRALGGTRTEDPATSSIEVDTASVPLFSDDVLLLTSDGLIDAYTGAPRLHREYEEADDTEAVRERILERAVTDDEIGEVILDSGSLSAAADRFVELSNERGGKDNLSLVLVRDESLPDSPVGSLPIRAYDPGPEQIADWDTVKQFPEDDADAVPDDAASSAADAGGSDTADGVENAERDDRARPDDSDRADGRERGDDSTTHVGERSTGAAEEDDDGSGDTAGR